MCDYCEVKFHDFLVRYCIQLKICFLLFVVRALRSSQMYFWSLYFLGVLLLNNYTTVIMVAIM